MLFKKRKGMIDISKLQKKGVISASKNETNLPPTKDGFIELGKNSQEDGQKEVYSKREIDSKITDLDNKIYRLEQRIELLEKKLGVENKSPGLISW
ncbi:hypothetical protein D6829_02350 [Candidatus Pacearchaeota archaeon]|nr:MAG: hypothetical protein D6829_02350 [Candidatus Pacearchaeota archaeon]